MIDCQMCLFIVNITDIECQSFFITHRFSTTQKSTFCPVNCANGLFAGLIRSHCKAIAIKVSYVKKYNRQQKKDANKVPNEFFDPFGPVQYY